MVNKKIKLSPTLTLPRGEGISTAFTLAEILITLGIIGVVAAITLPTLINNYQKMVTVNKLKKAYTILNQAFKLSEIDNGEYSTWEKYPDISQADYSEKYWKPYFKTVKICKTYKDCGYESNTPFYYQSGIHLGTPFPAQSYILEDGTYIFVMTNFSGEDNRILVDLNAGNKPNIMGKDIFFFQRYNGTIKGHDSGQQDCKKNSNSYVKGLSCANKIINDGWKISDDYPW